MWAVGWFWMVDWRGMGGVVGYCRVPILGSLRLHAFPKSNALHNGLGESLNFPIAGSLTKKILVSIRSLNRKNPLVIGHTQSKSLNKKY
jgi:hypothetical protein